MDSGETILVYLLARVFLPAAGLDFGVEEPGLTTLMSRGAPLQAMGRRAASLAGRILRGARPSELPVEKPTKFELIINLKTANVLGLTISESFLLRADRVIE